MNNELLAVIIQNVISITARHMKAGGEPPTQEQVIGELHLEVASGRQDIAEWFREREVQVSGGGVVYVDSKTGKPIKGPRTKDAPKDVH